MSGWIMLFLSVRLALQMDWARPVLQFVDQRSWIHLPLPVQYHVAVDGLSLSLVLLTTVVTLLSVYASTTIGSNRPRLYYSMIMLLVFSIQQYDG